MTPTERQEIVDAACTEVIERFGPVPEGSNARHAWWLAHTDDFRSVFDRLAAGEPAPPIQGAML